MVTTRSAKAIFYTKDIYEGTTERASRAHGGHRNGIGKDLNS